MFGSYGRPGVARVRLEKKHIADCTFNGQCTWGISGCLSGKCLTYVVAGSHFLSPYTLSSGRSCTSKSHRGAVDFTHLASRGDASKPTRRGVSPAAIVGKLRRNAAASQRNCFGRSRSAEAISMSSQLSSTNVRNSSTAVMVSLSFSTCGIWPQSSIIATVISATSFCHSSV